MYNNYTTNLAMSAGSLDSRPFRSDELPLISVNAKTRVDLQLGSNRSTNHCIQLVLDAEFYSSHQLANCGIHCTPKYDNSAIE